MSNYRIISSDDHVFEPPDLWTDRIEAEFRDRGPRVVRQKDGGDWWVCDGITVMGSGGGTQPGAGSRTPRSLACETHWRTCGLEAGTPTNT